MNWKTEASYKLKDYQARKLAMDNIPAELRRLESASTRIRSATTDGTPVSGGGGNAREDALISNIVQREELKRRLREAKLWVATVDRALAVLDDEERRVLELFFINRAKGNVERLMEELHLEKTRVYELKDRALRRFTLALYGIVET